MRGGWYSFESRYIKDFPIPEKADSMINEKAREVYLKRKQEPDYDTSTLEKEIDRLVYELYGLTEEDIQIVEGLSGD